MPSLSICEIRFSTGWNMIPLSITHELASRNQVKNQKRLSLEFLRIFVRGLIIKLNMLFNFSSFSLNSNVEKLKFKGHNK